MTKILLVEDDKSLREIYGVRLQAEGYEIVAAGDGEEALALSIKERPALILSDVMMPKISGFDMLDILRSTTETREIKVIMMTALSSEDQRERGEKLGADRYLVKSQVGIEDVVRTVHEVLEDLPVTMQPAGTLLGSTPAPIPDPLSTSAPASVHAPVEPQPQPIASSSATLPQPTAPFSSPTPRPAGLGDRVIQPIHTDDQQRVDMSAMMSQELNELTIPTMPVSSSMSSGMGTTPPAPTFATPTSTSVTPQPVDDTASSSQPTAPSSSIPPVLPQISTDSTPTSDPVSTPALDSATVTRPDVASLSPQPMVAQDTTGTSGMPTQPSSQQDNTPQPTDQPTT